MPRAKQRTPELRNRVLGVAVDALGEHGVSGFTTRRVAELGVELVQQLPNGPAVVHARLKNRLHHEKYGRAPAYSATCEPIITVRSLGSPK